MNPSTEYLKKLPDLPALESAELKNWKMYWIVAFPAATTLLFAGSFPWAYAKYGQYVGITGLISLALIGLLCLWLFIRALSGDFYWKTDGHGLTVRGILRRRFIDWMDVVEARAERSAFSKELVYKLRTSNHGTLTIPSRQDGAPRSGCDLAASVWQHLRRLGRAEGLILSEKALTFWDVIPDDLPSEMDWQGRSRRSDLTGAVCILVLFVAGLAYIVVAGFSNYFMISISLPMALGIAVIARTLFGVALLPAERIFLRDDGFEVKTLRGSHYVSWSDVIGAGWEQTYLAIRYANPRKQVWVPLESKDQESGKLVLAMIRRLRGVGHPVSVVIPDSLRATESLQQERSVFQAAQPHSIALVPTVGERVAYGIMSCVLIAWFPAFLIDRVALSSATSTTQTVPVYVLNYTLFLILGYLAAGTCYYKADAQGVEKRVFWWRRHARWDEVANYEHWETAGHHYKKWILRDLNGKKLVDITLDSGSKQGRASFKEFLTVALDQTLPQHAESKSWLARPWIPNEAG